MRSPRSARFAGIRSRRWMVKDKALCITPRVASSSMNQAMSRRAGKSDVHVIRPMEVVALRESGVQFVLWHRDPLDRLVSAYKMMGADKPVDFAERVLTQQNKHWDTQEEIHSIDGLFIPTIVHPYEGLKQTWKSEFPGFPLGHLHKSEDTSTWEDLKAMIPASMVSDIEAKYAVDNAYHAGL